MSTEFRATFNEQRKDFATNFGATLRVLGGSLVTIGGETVAVLPVDEYVASRLAELVNSAPETLDTLAEIAKALGDDPNFATTVLTELGKKVDKLEPHWSASAAYAVKTNGQMMIYPIFGTAEEYTLAYREAGGVIRVGRAIGNDDAVPLKQMQDALEGKVPKLSSAAVGNGVYTQRADGSVTLWGIGSTPKAWGLVTFTGAGTLKTNTATEDNDTVPLAQLNEALAGKADTATFDTLAKKVANLEAGVAADMSATDDTTAYVKPISADVAPYAELRAVGGMIHTHENENGERYLTEAKVTALDIVGKNLFDEKAVAGGVNGNGAAWNEAVVVTDEYIKVTRGAYGNSLYLTPYQFFLQEGQSVSISADIFIPTGGAPTLGANFNIGNPIKGFKNSALYPKLSAYGQWERHAKTVTAKQSGWYYLGLQGDGNASRYDGMDVRFKNIKVTTDTTDTTYSPYHKHTFAIPEAVQALDGYGWGFKQENGTSVYNGIDWDEDGNPTFIKRVERRVFTAADFPWEPDSTNLGLYFGYGLQTGATKAENGWLLCNKLPQGSPNTMGEKGCYIAGHVAIFFIGDYATTLTEWKDCLDRWEAEGDPFTIYYELAEPIVTDISHLITEDNLIPVEGGGVIVANNENEEAAPTTIIYPLRA